MKRYVLFTLAFVSIVSLACSAALPFFGTVTGSGRATSETRPVSGFTGVDFQTTGEVIITQGAADSVVVQADDNLLRLLRTEVVGSQLRISQPSNVKISTRNPIRFIITMRAIENVALSGTGEIKIDGLDSDLVKLDLSGTGALTAHGKAKTVQVSLSGTGFIRCDELEADSVVARHSGNGEITVRARHALDANMTGVGAINYCGDPARITRTITGHGMINALP